MNDAMPTWVREDIARRHRALPASVLRALDWHIAVRNRGEYWEVMYAIGRVVLDHGWKPA